MIRSHTLVNETDLRLCDFSATIAKVADYAGVSQEIHVRIVGNREIEGLNRKWRGVAAPTDVLTFPSGMGHPFPAGDLVISADYARAQAEARNVPFEDELIALIVHGVLHLAGYDDEDPSDRRRMQSRMNEIGELIGTPIDAEWTSVLHQDDE